MKTKISDGFLCIINPALVSHEVVHVVLLLAEQYFVFDETCWNSLRYLKLKVLGAIQNLEIS